LFRRPQQPGGFATGGPVDVDYVRDQVPGLVGGQVDTESNELSRRSSPRAIRGSPSAKRCLSK
jgi:hypothetical protein